MFLGGVENITRIYPGTVNWDFGIESFGLKCSSLTVEEMTVNIFHVARASHTIDIHISGLFCWNSARLGGEPQM